MSTETEELIELLPETSSYDGRTKDEIAEAIRSGDVTIEPGTGLPVLRDERGKLVKGGGRNTRHAEELAIGIRRLRQHENNRDWFDKQMTAVVDGKAVRQAIFDKGLETILEGARGHEILVRWYLENHTGKAKESSNSAMGILAERLLEALVGEVPTTIEGEWEELDD